MTGMDPALVKLEARLLESIGHFVPGRVLAKAAGVEFERFSNLIKRLRTARPGLVIDAKKGEGYRIVQVRDNVVVPRRPDDGSTRSEPMHVAFAKASAMVDLLPRPSAEIVKSVATESGESAADCVQRLIIYGFDVHGDLVAQGENPACPEADRVMMVFAPIAGSPPSLEWIALDRLSIDTTYQRSAATVRSRILIARIARGWDWRLYQPLSVARRGDADLFVVDGQHRLAAARLRGDILFLPVVIASFVSAAEEAAAFEGMNRQRKVMTRLERYRAGAVAGDPATVAALQMLSAAGLTLAPDDNTERWKAGYFAAIGSVVREARRFGRVKVEAALCALAEAFAGEPLTCGGALFGGIAMIYAKPPADFDPDLLIGTLASVAQDEWVDLARRHLVNTGRAPGFNSADAMSEVILANMASRAERAGRIAS